MATIDVAPIGFPVNAAGEIVAEVGVGGTTVVGTIPNAFVSVNPATKALVIAGISGGGSAAPAPAAITSSRNLVAADNGGTIYNNTANPYTITVPAGLPVGFGVTIVQNSTGVVTVATAGGATVGSISGFTKTAGQYAVISLIQTTANGYVLVGAGAA